MIFIVELPEKNICLTNQKTLSQNIMYINESVFLINRQKWQNAKTAVLVLYGAPHATSVSVYSSMFLVIPYYKPLVLPHFIILTHLIMISSC